MQPETSVESDQFRQTQSQNQSAASADDSNSSRPRKKRRGITRYHADIAIRVCERIATTPLSLTGICEADDMPGVATLFRWLRDHPDFLELYTIAKQAQAEMLLDEALDIVDDTSQDVIVTPEGRTVFNTVAIQRCRMRVEYRKWIASRLLPRKYGNRPDLASPAASSAQPSTGPILTEERRRKIIAARQQEIDAHEAAQFNQPHDPEEEAYPGNDAAYASEAGQGTGPAPSPHAGQEWNSGQSQTHPQPAPSVSPIPTPAPKKYTWRDVPTPKREKTTMNKACS